jgi:hypothetical protein
VKAAVAAVYLILMGAYFYAWKEDIGSSLGWALFVGLAALQLAAGASVGTWSAVALPFVAILVAVPFGYGEGIGQEAPIWLYYGFLLSVPAAILVAIGVGARKLAARQR